MRKILPPALFLLCWMAMLVLHLVFPVVKLIIAPYNYVGGFLLLGGLALAQAGSRLFHAKETNILTFNDPEKLVVSGVFSYSRNPMYLGFVVAILGWAILLGSFSPFGVCLVFFAITNWWYVRFEERRMHAVFGDQYKEYCKTVRRWL